MVTWWRRSINGCVPSTTSNLPVFKLGSMICARKSVLLKWVEDEEERHAGEVRKEASIG